MNKFLLTQLSLAMGLAVAMPAGAQPNNKSLSLNVSQIASYTEECGGEESCAEISAFDPASSRAFITNAAENQLRILNVGNAGFSEFKVIDLSVYGGGPNSVAVKNGLVVVAIEADDKQANGSVEVFDTEGNHLHSVAAGALPDMITFTPDGKYVLTANEGEPNDDYDVDPEGSITIIDTATWTPRTAGFNAFDNATLKNVRIFGPGASVSEDLEPEYIAVSADSTTAWVTLQENNAIAKVDIASANVTNIFGLGYKNHSQKKNALDASDKDDAINIKTWPVFGMYMPDAIASFQRGNANFLITANEGDSRDYDGYSEEVRVKDLTLDPEVFPNADELQQKENLGRLKTTTSQGDIDGDGDFDRIYSYGGRSFSVWNANGKLVFDSGALIEKTLAQYQAEGMDIWLDSRSDDKGPEPESVTVGELGGKTFAFVGLERTSGVMIVSLDQPQRPEVVGFINTLEAGDIGPEGLQFISRSENSGWLLISNEISNTTSLYEISL